MLLELLTAAERTLFGPGLARVRVERGQTLIWPGEAIAHVHFPIDSLVSVIATGAAGEEVETALVGCEGMVGLPVFLGSPSTPTGAVVRVAGEAWRLPADALTKACAASAPLRGLLLRYAEALLLMNAQGVLCHRLHTVRQQVARWLVLARDYLARDTFALTHEDIANTLAVRRATITEALASLEEAGLIERRRGAISVLDGRGLTAAACACYGIVRREFDRLLGPARGTYGAPFLSHSGAAGVPG